MTQMRKKRKFELGRPASNTKVCLLLFNTVVLKPVARLVGCPLRNPQSRDRPTRTAQCFVEKYFHGKFPLC